MPEYKVGDIVTFKTPVMGTIEKVEVFNGRTIYTILATPIAWQCYEEHIIYKHE
jgi:hypothetical protein